MHNGPWLMRVSLDSGNSRHCTEGNIGARFYFCCAMTSEARKQSFSYSHKPQHNKDSPVTSNRAGIQHGHRILKMFTKTRKRSDIYVLSLWIELVIRYSHGNFNLLLSRKSFVIFPFWLFCPDPVLKIPFYSTSFRLWNSLLF